MDTGNILAWVGQQMEEVELLQPSPPYSWPSVPTALPPSFTPASTQPSPAYSPITPGYSPPTPAYSPPTPAYSSPTPATPATPPSPATSTPTSPGCTQRCTKDFSLVCGSNGQTYNNPCMLELAACKTATQIYVVSEGKCPEEVEKKTTTTKAPIEDSSNAPVAVCKRTEFTCSADNACISYIKRCNGRADCSDGQVSLMTYFTHFHTLCRMRRRVMVTAV